MNKVEQASGFGETADRPPVAEVSAPVSDRRGWILAVLGAAQLMVVLDNTIVNVALPSAQADLGFGTGGRQWVVTAYALAFGSLLLLGGRLTDLMGRKRAFIIGLIGFAGASAAGGAATGFGMLIAARAVQGAAGALLAPAVLSLITTTFPGGRSRTRAFAIIGTIVSAGGGMGLVLGGVLTEYINWRWTMYVNVVFAVGAALGAWLLLPSRRADERPRMDLIGTVLACVGLLGVVFGFAQAETRGWASPVVLGALLGGVLVLAGFVLRQHLAPAPLLPLRVLRDRERVAAYVNRFASSTGNFGIIFFTTFFLQENLHLSPVLAGLGTLPVVIGVIVSSNVLGSASWLVRIRPKVVIIASLVLTAASLVWLSRLEPSSSYWTVVLGPLFLFGIGQGVNTTLAMSNALVGLDPDDVGVGSALFSVMQQLGGSVGTALLSTVASTVTAGYVSSHVGSRDAAAVHGYNAAFLTMAAVFASAALLCGILMRSGKAR
ncbi:DHA2 family efflux MFS transporter permease subunit [Streptomyces sp. T028]|uniref:DHA2 family efflux MFS transporter permease subunit n=1 Tax=Streptomyces sp. T028 TaxID=3394379 RepID=UPI003A86A949